MHSSVAQTTSYIQGKSWRIRQNNKLTVLLSSLSSDSHTWNLVFLQLLIEHFGHEVVNLGACTPDSEIIDHCLSERPDLVVISTVNGHGRIDGARLIQRLRSETELQSQPVIIGGKLSTRGQADKEVEYEMLRVGFNAVFNASAELTKFEQYIKTLAETQVSRMLGVEWS